MKSLFPYLKLLCSALMLSLLTFTYADEECRQSFSIPPKKKWKSYPEAQAYVQEHGIQNAQKYREWNKSGKRPKDIPSHPEKVYKEEWKTWGDFLGIHNTHKKKWRDYESAKEYVQRLKLKSYRQYAEWSRSGTRPQDIPSQPSSTYKEWEDWRIFLGIKNKYRKEWMSYEEAQAFIQQIGIKTKENFQKWSRSEERPKNLPTNPNTVYKKEWKGWGDFLGTGNKNKKEWRSYTEAKEYIQQIGIKTSEEFKIWRVSNERPQDFPSEPERVYKEEWKGWGDFLGTGNKNKKEWRSYAKAKDYIQSLGIRTQKEYARWSSSEERPEDIPSSPDKSYPYHWKDWKSFLGQKQPIMRFRDARTLIRKKNLSPGEFYQWLKSNERPKNFPRYPHIAYEGEWISVENFLGIKYMTFKEAQTYVQFLNVLHPKDYLELLKSEMGEGLPPDPSKAYPKKWRGWDHFLIGK